MAPDGRKALGALGERLAAQRLEAAGYLIHARNVRTRAGEIDIIAERDGVLAFIEVRSRRGMSKGSAAESLTPLKQRRLVSLVEAYGQSHEGLPAAWRIDVIAIDFTADGRMLSMQHIENAITGD